jgi:site-specific DNA-methyltransferase (adenine-specific)
MLGSGMNQVKTLAKPRQKRISVVEKPLCTKNIGKSIAPLYFNTSNIFLYQGDTLNLHTFTEEFIDLVVTSPPYNVDIQYNSNDDDLSYEAYLDFTKKWITNVFIWTKNQGRFLLNIPLDKNKGGKKAVARILQQLHNKLAGNIIQQ